MEEIGARLRAAREGKGISLEVAEEETRIRRKYIEALEEGAPGELPGEVYLKGFLRSYGNYLALDGAALVEEYKESRRGRRPGSQAASGDEAASRAAAASRPERAGTRRGRAPAQERSERSRPATPGRPDFQRPQLSVLSDSGTRRRLTGFVLLVIVIGAIGYLGWLIALQFSPDPTGSAPAPGSTGTAAPGNATPTTLTPPPASTAPVQAPPPKLPDPPKVTMTRGEGEQVIFTVPAGTVTVRWELPGAERLWVSWYADDVKVFEGDAVDARGVVRAPLELSGKALRLRMGHMRGVSLTVNGQRFQTPLENGPYTLIIQGQ